MSRLKTGELNLDDRALNAWMALHKLLWKFGVMSQYTETSFYLRGITRLQNRVDNEN